MTLGAHIENAATVPSTVALVLGLMHFDYGVVSWLGGLLLLNMRCP